ncbi:uncharacterized protein LOC135496806 [Lineus longissimus]|uniref:uncharacterized protein LOC135496806 n=1 Tax=Lineus longissimus TaxID=88925 RepID=UPI00315DDB0C
MADLQDLSEDQLKQKIADLRADLTAAKLNEANAVGSVRELRGESKALKETVDKLKGKDTVYVGRDRKLEKLRGAPVASKDPEVEEWVRDAQGIIESRKLKGQDAINFVTDHLAGDARVEVDSRGKIDDVQDLFKILRNVFDIADSLPQLRRKYYARLQAEEESVVQYSHALARIHQRMEMLDSALKATKEEALRAQLAEGFKDPQLRREALRWIREKNGSFFELRDWATEWVRQGEGSDLKVKAKVREHQAEPALMEMLKEQNVILKEQVKAQQELAKLIAGMNGPTSKGQKYDQRGRACFECGSLDHLIKDCPDAQKKAKAKKNTGKPKAKTNEQAATGALN